MDINENKIELINKRATKFNDIIIITYTTVIKNDSCDNIQSCDDNANNSYKKQ